MDYSTSDLCDHFADVVDVLEPMFINFGGRHSFGGRIKTVKCFENNELIRQLLSQDGTDQILLIDGGGSTRRALIDIELAELALVVLFEVAENSDSSKKAEYKPGC